MPFVPDTVTSFDTQAKTETSKAAPEYGPPSPETVTVREITFTLRRLFSLPLRYACAIILLPALMSVLDETVTERLGACGGELRTPIWCFCEDSVGSCCTTREGTKGAIGSLFSMKRKQG